MIQQLSSNDMINLSPCIDVDDCLYTFEMILETYKVDKALSMYRLIPWLMGRPNRLILLCRKNCTNYNELVSITLRHYNIDKDILRQRFRAASKADKESYNELAIC